MKRCPPFHEATAPIRECRVGPRAPHDEQNTCHPGMPSIGDGRDAAIASLDPSQNGHVAARARAASA